MRGKWIYMAVRAGGDHSRGLGPTSTCLRIRLERGPGVSASPCAADSARFLKPWILTQASQKRKAILLGVLVRVSPTLLCLRILGVVGSHVRNPRNGRRLTKPYLKGVSWRKPHSSRGPYLSPAIINQPMSQQLGRLTDCSAAGNRGSPQLVTVSWMNHLIT